MGWVARFRQRHPLWFSVAAAVAAIGLILLTALVIGLAVGLLARVQGAGFNRDLWTNEYLLTLLQEALAALAMWGLLRLCGLGWVPGQAGYGLAYGLDVGRFPLVLITLALVELSSYQLQQGARLAAPLHIAVFLGAVLMIGIAEEFAFRGLVAVTLLQHFGTGRKGLWQAATLSGLLFGAVHCVNMLDAEPAGVLVQMASASVLGMLFAAVYFRSGNIWVTVLLHAYMDLAGLLESGLFAAGEGLSGSAAETISGYGVQNLTAIAIYLIPTAFLLRGRMLPSIQALWAQRIAEFRTEAQPG